MLNKKSISSAWLWAIVVVCVATLVVAMVLLFTKNKEINSFESCKDAGGTILESYPEQCLLDGKTFTNDTQSVDSQSGDYIGLTEQDALAKAATENKIARVVERNGESLAVTMDYMPGRLNLSVKNDKVYKVQVEGEDSQ